MLKPGLRFSRPAQILCTRKKTLTPFLAAFSAVSLLFTALTLSACGSSIQNAQDFAPNEAPVIGQPESILPDGTAVNSTNLISGQTIMISIPAYDPEGGDLNFLIDSAYGSVKNRQYQNGIFSFLFYTKNVTAGTPVDLTVSAIDPKKATTTILYTVGSGKPVPQLSLSVSGKDSISSIEDTTVVLKSTGTGYYQFFCDNSISSLTAMKAGMQYPLDPNSDGSIPQLTFKVASISSSSTDADARLIVKGENKLWVAFKDPNGKILSASCAVTTADIFPSAVYSATSAVSGTSVTATVTATFNKDMNTTSLNSASAALGTAEGTITGRVVTAKSIVFTITGLTTGKTYALTLAGAKDTEGNEVASYTYSFTTLNQMTGISLSDTTVSLKTGETKQLSVTFSPANPVNKTITWSSLDPTIASVDTAGLVTAKKMGTTSVSATSEDGAKVSGCTFIVNGSVIYDANGATSGTVPIDAGTYKINESVSVLNISGKLIKIHPSSDDASYTFEKWNTKSDGSGIDYTPGQFIIMADANMTLYAKWKAYTIGDEGPAGGIIFYDRGTYVGSGGTYNDGYSFSITVPNWRYMEAAKTDTGTAISYDVYYTLCTWDYPTKSGSAINIGSGYMNTEYFVYTEKTQSYPYATKICLELTSGGYSDWFLPSINELVQMCNNRTLITGFSNATYWSSSHSASANAMRALTFPADGTTAGTEVSKDYGNSLKFRAIREF